MALADDVAPAPPAPEPPAPPPGPSLAHVLGRLAALEASVQAVVAARRELDPGIDDPFRGLYIGDEDVDRVLARSLPRPAPSPAGAEIRRRVDDAAAAASSAGATLRLADLARHCDLDATDEDLLLVALAPDLDPRFERLYGYLHDDVSRRRASVGLALELAGLRARPTPEPGTGSAPGARSSPAGCSMVEDPDRPLLTRSLRVPDRVAAHLLGERHRRPAVADLLVAPVAVELADDRGLADVLARAPGGDGGAAASSTCRERSGRRGRTLRRAAPWPPRGRLAWSLDLDRLGPDPADDPGGDGRAPLRRARPACAAPAWWPARSTTSPSAAPRRSGARRAAASRSSSPAAATGTRRGRRRVPLTVTAPAPDSAERARAVARPPRRPGRGRARPGRRHDPVPPDARAGRRRGRRRRAARPADRPARRRRRLRRAPGPRTRAGLERLARRIEPRVAWDDLVLPPAALEQPARAHRAGPPPRPGARASGGCAPGGGRGRGVTALFAGDSGTGKTMSAEVIAGDLGLDLYVIDLSTVVDKYIGETEKNLDRIFTEADRRQRRAAVRRGRRDLRQALRGQGRPRPLRQRRGRLPAPADGAVRRARDPDDQPARQRRRGVHPPARRDRRLPDARGGRTGAGCGSATSATRCRWRPTTSTSTSCARQFELSGGNIRNVASTAAYLAAGRDGRLGMADLVRGHRSASTASSAG